ncbi:MAG: GHKL domain-containing protein [Pseudomonadales bacterium]|nr:GHKL domain-containing protein [Pseudomonadales bacterium]MCP5173255.1 GHKL domain-containing protein [Pseudomonadales bacterium]
MSLLPDIENASQLAGGFALFVLTYFLAATAVRSKLIPQRVVRHPLIHSLALVSITGVLTYFGMVEMAGRFGLSAILAFMSLTVAFILAPLFLEPLRWISHVNRFPSTADLLVYRFRTLRFGKLTTAGMFLVLLPMATAQIEAVALGIQYLLSVKSSVTNRLLAGLPIAATVILLLWRYSAGRNHHDIVSVAMAAGTILLLVSLLLVGTVSVFGIFDSFEGMSEWLAAIGTNTATPDFEEGYALIMTFMLAGMAMPQIFYLQSKVRFATAQLNYASWCFPLLLLLTTLPMFPLLWSGSAMELNVAEQMYVLALPNILHMPGVSLLVIAGGFSAAAGGLIVIAMSTSQMLVNYWVLPAQKSLAKDDLYHWYGKQTRIVASIIILAALIFGAFSTVSSITDLALISLVGILQFTPAAVATFYFPSINRQGVTCGIIGGLSLWFIGLVLPIFLGEWVWTVPWLNAPIPFGSSNWHNWLLEATMVNLTLLILASRFSGSSPEEIRHAELCALDTLPVPQRVELAKHSLTEIRQRLTDQVGEAVANAEVDKALQGLNLTDANNQPYALRLVRDELTANLCKVLGVYTTQRVIDQAIPLGRTNNISADDINLLETELSKHGKQLTGLPAELNKLRLHHRNTLNNLPIGACSVGSDGEILLWNHAMEKFTGISAATTQGTLISALPSPWNLLLGEFSQSSDTQQLAIKVSLLSRTCCCNLFKAAITRDSPKLLGSQVLLLEDITDTLLLTQELAHTERLASVGRLAAGVAHEIGNPVTGISCLAQDVKSEHTNKGIQESMDMILSQTGRISKIVSSLINFSRSGDRGTPLHVPFSLRDAVSEAVQLMILQVDKKPMSYQNNVSENEKIEGDLHQITQVFVNLLSNARDASPPSSTIIIDARRDNDSVMVTVTDQGKGIDDELLKQVFEPFVTTKEAGEGTGLGLSLVYSIIKNHGGDIHFENLNPGGRMHIQLPIKNNRLQQAHS